MVSVGVGSSVMSSVSVLESILSLKISLILVGLGRRWSSSLGSTSLRMALTSFSTRSSMLLLLMKSLGGVSLAVGVGGVFAGGFGFGVCVDFCLVMAVAGWIRAGCEGGGRIGKEEEERVGGLGGTVVVVVSRALALVMRLRRASQWRDHAWWFFLQLGHLGEVVCPDLNLARQMSVS